MEFSDVQIVSDEQLLPFEPITICPIGDIQYGAEGCALEDFKAHLAWTLAQPNPYYIGMGDFVDFGSPSNRGILKALIEKGELYDTGQDIINGAALQHAEEILEILKPTKGRWLGMVEGHHFWSWPDGITSDMLMCRELDAPFLGTCGIIRVKFVGYKQRGAPLHIWVHHGRGSGALQSSALNRLERYAAGWENVDIFLMAHQHKQVNAKIARLAPQFKYRHGGPGGRRGSRGELVEREVILAGTGGFMQGYLEGTGADRPRATYVEKGMMNPLPLGAPIFTAEPHMKSSNRTYVRVRITN